MYIFAHHLTQDSFDIRSQRWSVHLFYIYIYSNPDFYPIKKMGPIIEELSGWIVLLDATCKMWETCCAELHHYPQDSSPGKELSKVGRRQ